MHGRGTRNTSVSTAGGNVNLSTSGIPTCRADGTFEFGTTGSGGVIATLSGVTDYRARCFAANSSIRCTVEAQ